MSVSPSPLGVIPRMRPRLLFRSPIMSPANVSGTVTSAFITGSSSTGLASRTPLENAYAPAISNDMPDESTEW